MHLAARTRVAREEAAATLEAAVRDAVAQVIDALAPRRVRKLYLIDVDMCFAGQSRVVSECDKPCLQSG